jgi:hypothetical protein
MRRGRTRRDPGEERLGAAGSGTGRPRGSSRAVADLGARPAERARGGRAPGRGSGQRGRGAGVGPPARVGGGRLGRCCSRGGRGRCVRRPRSRPAPPWSGPGPGTLRPHRRGDAPPPGLPAAWEGEEPRAAGGRVSHPVLEGKLNANHVRARISYSRTQQLHNMDIITQCSK